MTTRPLDTTEKAWAIMEEGIRRMTPQQRVGRAVSLTILSHRLALAEIRRRHPDESDRQHRLRLAARMIDAPTMKEAFSWVDDGSPTHTATRRPSPPPRTRPFPRTPPA